MKHKQPNKRKRSTTRATTKKLAKVVIAYSPHHQAKNVAHELARRAKQTGVNEIARRSGLSAMLISRFTNGQPDVLWNSICAIAEAVGYKLILQPIPDEELRTALVQRLLPFKP